MSDISDDKDARFQAWLDKVCARPMPSDRVARVKTLARELAEGVMNEFWQNSFAQRGLGPLRLDSIGEDVNIYVKRRWNSISPSAELLQWMGYFDSSSKLTNAARQLLSDTIPANIFISYSRKQSSAFALLVHTWLNNEGFKAFIDKELNVGLQWEATLRKRIEGCDYMVLILGEESLPSENIRNEIKWAVEFKVQIIPIWHHRYVFESDRQHLPDELFEVVNKFNAFSIAGENPLTTKQPFARCSIV